MYITENNVIYPVYSQQIMTVKTVFLFVMEIPLLKIQREHDSPQLKCGTAAYYCCLPHCKNMPVVTEMALVSNQK